MNRGDPAGRPYFLRGLGGEIEGRAGTFTKNVPRSSPQNNAFKRSQHDLATPPPLGD